jgi:hypothetical protein
VPHHRDSDETSDTAGASAAATRSVVAIATSGFSEIEPMCSPASHAASLRQPDGTSHMA